MPARVASGETLDSVRGALSECSRQTGEEEASSGEEGEIQESRGGGKKPYSACTSGPTVRRPIIDATGSVTAEPPTAVTAALITSAAEPDALAETPGVQREPSPGEPAYQPSLSSSLLPSVTHQRSPPP